MKNTQQKLTYEEHKRIDEFLRHWNKEGREVFDLIRKAFGEKGKPTINMAKAVNLMSSMHQYCETKSFSDAPYPLNYGSEECEKWRMLYYKIGLWITSGWENIKNKDVI